MKFHKNSYLKELRQIFKSVLNFVISKKVSRANRPFLSAAAEAKRTPKSKLSVFTLSLSVKEKEYWYFQYH